jgi:phospholipase/carboxylesterase
MTEQSAAIIKIDRWVIRLRIPAVHGPHPVLVMLHGLSGDENSMWVFAGRLPGRFMLIAPRAIYPSSVGGYSWVPPVYQPEPGIEGFQSAIESLNDLLTPARFPEGDFGQIHLMGFSQGAALAYAYAFLQPERVASLAGLSGFVPDGAELRAEGRPLEGRPVFVAHGTLDEMVPVERSRQAVEILEKAGARVIYCEDQVGHKLSASCFRGLGEFFRREGAQR